MKKHQIPLNLNQSQMIHRQEMFIALGLSDFEEFCNIFREYNQKVPTQVKLFYDCLKRKAKAEYSYDLHYSNSDYLTPSDIFNQWFEEVKSVEDKLFSEGNS